LETAIVRVLVVDDTPPWRRTISSIIQKEHGLQVVGEAGDGFEAIQKAQELRPDLILLDIGLPSLNGIEAARRIRERCPNSKVLFLSAQRDWDIVEEALRAGAVGYVVKSDAASELLPAVRAVLQGKQFVSASFTGHDSNAPKDHRASAIRHCHEVAFYVDDGSVIDGYARFIESALKSGNPVIVIVTEVHRAGLLRRLEADGVNVSAAIERGRYIPLDAADALPTLTFNGAPDPVRCAKVIGDLIMGAATRTKGEHGWVAVCGEISSILLSRGDAEGAIKLEHLWDKITRGYEVRTLCGYLSNAFPKRESDPIFARICAEHSAVHELGY
jgi:DNA-binding NarL/FixJ family response regulator